jgi:hypothetical protein
MKPWPNRCAAMIRRPLLGRRQAGGCWKYVTAHCSPRRLSAAATELGRWETSYAMPPIAYFKTDCEHCSGHIEYPSELAGQFIRCPHCQQTTTLPSHFAPPPPRPPPPGPPPPVLQSAPLPYPQSIRATIRSASSFAGGGCALQGLGLVCFVLAILTIMTIIGPIIFGILGLWLLIYGGRKASWCECSACGGKLSHARVSVCPYCNASFQ